MTVGSFPRSAASAASRSTRRPPRRACGPSTWKCWKPTISGVFRHPSNARGYLRTYASYLGLSPEDLVRRMPAEPRRPNLALGLALGPKDGERRPRVAHASAVTGTTNAPVVSPAIQARPECG